MSIRTATALIDGEALLHNYQVIKDKVPNSKVLAVLKANAYGHGLTHIAGVLSGIRGIDNQRITADSFGVARIEEALELRAAGVKQAIVLLEGFFSADDIPIVADNHFEIVIHNEQQLNALLKAELKQPLTVWLKIDTGMHRLGIQPKQFSFFYQQLNDSINVAEDIILMSHLACADDIQDDSTVQQLTCFNTLTNHLLNAKSLANSAAICAWPQTHFDWVRPGVMLYGISPTQHQSAVELNLQPVMTLQSSIIAIRYIHQGDTIGYGNTWVSDNDTFIAVVAIGYGDGYPRHAVSGTPVLVNGRRVSLVGRVSMDMIMIDLGQQATDHIGDVVTLWGKGLPIEEVAQCASTIAYELICNITSRVKKLDVFSVKYSDK